MSLGMVFESSRLLFGPGDASRASSCISFCLRLCSLPKSLLWPQSLESLPRLATQSAFTFLYSHLCAVLDSQKMRWDRVRIINHVLEPELQQLKDEQSCLTLSHRQSVSLSFYCAWPKVWSEGVRRRIRGREQPQRRKGKQRGREETRFDICGRQCWLTFQNVYSISKKYSCLGSLGWFML